MNTHGHEDVAYEAGLPLLKQAFSPRMGDPRFAAFYLGNWLTDLSQIDDPVAFKGGRDKIKDIINSVISYLLNEVYYKNAKKLFPLARFINDVHTAQEALLNAIDWLFNAFLEKQENGMTHWRTVVMSGVMLKGYFKFVHPAKKGDPLRMDLEAYLAIVNKRFTAYYPHEHLDRPVNPSPTRSTVSGQTDYDDRLAHGPESKPLQQKYDLYKYLRDHIKIISGILTDLDQKWASRYLQPAGGKVTDNDIDWNLGLAELGHAVHQIEDFFAHSNFIEHAAEVMGGDFIPPKLQIFDDERYRKRLRKYDPFRPEAAWNDYPRENYVVTGYFDVVDTFISFLHLVEGGLLGLLGTELRDPTREVHKILDVYTNEQEPGEIIVQRFDKLMHDFFEALSGPDKLSDKNNDVAKAIKKIIDDSFFGDVNDFIDELQKAQLNSIVMERVIAELPLYKELTSEAENILTPEQVAFILKLMGDFIHGVMVIFKFGKAAYSVYDAYTTIQEFLAAPNVWLTKSLSTGVAKKIMKMTGFTAKELLYTAFGMERLGCHSLISKDHGQEWLYTPMKNCAMAVHHYVIKTILRWQDPTYHNRAETEKWVNWLELLEHFLNHPGADVVCTNKKEVPVTRIHVLTEDEKKMTKEKLLKKLVEKYQPFILQPTGLPPFSEQTILQANCKDAVQIRVRGRMVEKIIETSLGPAGRILFLPIRLRHIIIPFIKHEEELCDPNAIGVKWYMAIMKDGWKKIETNNDHVMAYYSSIASASGEIKKAFELREQLKQEYLKSTTSGIPPN